MTSLFFGSYERAVVDGNVMLPESFPVISGPLFYAAIAWDGNEGFCFAPDAQHLPDDIILHTPRAAQVRDGLLELPLQILAQAGKVIYIIGVSESFEIYTRGFPQLQEEDEAAQGATQQLDEDMRQNVAEIYSMAEELRHALERKSRSRQGSAPQQECIQGVFITDKAIRAFYDYYQQFHQNHHSQLFNPYNLGFVSGSFDELGQFKIGSLYFRDGYTQEGGRIRLTHEDGPHVSRHNNVERYTLPVQRCEEYEDWSDRRQRTFGEMRNKIEELGGQIASPTGRTDQTIIEILPDGRYGADHISRGFPVRPPNLNQDQINILRAAAEFTEAELPRHMPHQSQSGSRNREDRYYADLKNDFLRLIMRQNGMCHIPVD